MGRKINIQTMKEKKHKRGWRSEDNEEFYTWKKYIIFFETLYKLSEIVCSI